MSEDGEGPICTRYRRWPANTFKLFSVALPALYLLQYHDKSVRSIDQCMAGWITVTRNFNLITPHFCTWLHLVSHKLAVVIDIEIWQWKAILGAFEHNWIISAMTITVNITMKSTEHRKSPLKIPQNWTWLEFLTNWVTFWYNLVSSSLESGGQVVRQCQLSGGWKSYLNPSREQRHNVTLLEGIMLPLPRSSSFTSRRSGGSSWRSWWSWW